MKQQDVFIKIGNILQELNEQYDYLKSQENQIDDLELELFAANAHFLTDHLEILRKLNTQFLKSLPAHEPAAEIAAIPEKEAEAQNEPLFQPYQQTEEEQTSTGLISDIAAGVSTQTASVNDGGHEAETGPLPGGFEFDFSPSSIYNEADDSAAVTVENPAGNETINNEAANYTTENVHSPDIYDQIAVNAAQPETEASAHDMDMHPDTGNDHFGYVRAVEPETIRHELVLDDAEAREENLDTAQPQEEETVAEALAEIEITPQPAAEPQVTLYDNEPPATANAEPEKPLTLNERLSGRQNTAQTIAAQPVKDLKSAITLNDKMLFVRDLFNGYSLAYSEAIEILNRFNNYEDADRFLTANYVAKNNWDSKADTKDKFFELLKRRYA